MRKQIEFVIRIIFILMILCWFHFQAAYALDINGKISTDGRWATADSPINITGDVHVEMNTTLTVDPGVEVVFQSSPDISQGCQGYSIRIDGTLIARGEQMDPILFTAADKSVPWGAIMFSDTSSDWDEDAATGSVIEFCMLEYGGNEPEGSGMISSFNAMPLIARNAIRFGVDAGISALVSEDPAVISSLSSDIPIISNQIYNNVTGIRFSAEGGVIEDNYFLNNNRAIALQVRSNDVQVKNNTVISSASELFGTGIWLFVDEAASGISDYQWTQTAGTSVVLSNPQSALTAFMGPDPGSNVEVLSFDLTVTNKNGLQSTNTVSVTIIGDNPPPVASAGADSNVQFPQEEGVAVIVTLSGAGSSDPYLGIATYAWEQLEGLTVELQGADSIAPTFTVPASISAGDRMTFQLTVMDQGGLTSTDTVDVVFYDDNIFPAAAAGEDRTVSQGSTVALNGTGSSDQDGSISSYTWVQTDGLPVDLINPNTAIPYFDTTDNTTPETVVFRLQVTDNGGLQATDDVSITVNSSLIADISASPSAGGLVILDGSTSIDYNATVYIDIGSNVFEINNENAGLIALTVAENAAFQLNITGNNFNAIRNEGYIVYTYNWSGQAPIAIEMPENWWGTDDAMVIENLIYDQKNNYELPEIDYQPFAGHDISGVGSSLPYPPLSDAGPDLETAVDNSVTLDGSGSYDPDGIARYHWQQIDGPEVNLKNNDQAVASFISPSGGVDGATIQFQLIVSTDDTFSHKDTVNVIVSPDEALSKVDVGSCFVQSVTPNQVLNSLSVKWLFMFFISLIAVPGVFRRFKKFIPAIFIVQVALALSVPVAHAGYLSVGGGAGGDADEVNVTFETGAKDIDVKNLDMLFGIGVFFIPHSNNDLPSSTISLSCPNDDCVCIGSARKGTEVGFAGKLGVEVGSSNFYVSAIGGFSAYTESKLSRSPATGRVYEDSSDSKVEALYGGGVSYFMDYKWNVVFHVDYDNIRGVTGAIGWHW